MERTRILELLNELSILLPEQRVGQIIFNYINANFNNYDPFFVRDEDLVKVLEDKVLEIKASKSLD